MRITMPQIIMLNHAAWYNAERAGLHDHKKKNKQADDKDPVVVGGKRMSEMSTGEISTYFHTPE